MTPDLGRSDRTEVYVARQPLLDRRLNTFGYELLFRACGASTAADVVDGDAATANILINAVTEIGLANVVGDKIAFVNVTAHYLCNPDLLECLPTDRVVLEILEDVEPTRAVVEGITHLAERGYTFTLDDFVATGVTAPLLEHVAFVKYDIRDITLAALRARVQLDHTAGRRVVVERIERHDEHRAVAAAGADFFQGYFFAEPATITATSIASNNATLIRMLAKVNDPTASLDEVVEELTRDVSMSVKVLRFVNSAANGLCEEIDSIQHAAVLIGLNRLRSWTNLALLASRDDTPIELITLAMTRARFCDIIARRLRVADPRNYYTVGMLSLLDAMTGTPMHAVVAQLALNHDVRSALLGAQNSEGVVLGLAIEIERNPDTTLIAGDGTRLLDAQQEAMSWATGLLQPLGHVPSRLPG